MGKILNKVFDRKEKVLEKRIVIEMKLLNI